MARRGRASKQAILPDERYNCKDITLFVNLMMRDGKKGVSLRIMHGVLEEISKKHGTDDQGALASFHKALSNVMPEVEVKSRRVGGATYQVPVEVRHDRAKALAIRWILEAARKRSGKSMIEKLLAELLDAEDKDGSGRGKGGAVKKKDDTHKMAEANRAFAHFRW
jgi:small subunit ribosomal protein S7